MDYQYLSTMSLSCSERRSPKYPDIKQSARYYTLFFLKSYKQKESYMKVTIIYLCKSPLRHVDFFLVHFDNCITIKHTLSWNQETRVHFIVQHLSQTSSGNFYRQLLHVHILIADPERVCSPRFKCAQLITIKKIINLYRIVSDIAQCMYLCVRDTGSRFRGNP